MRTSVIQSWVFIFTLITSFWVQAVPGSLSYQGYLTDPSGSPVNGTVSITFALYDTDVAGSLQWSESQSVDVSQGLFQVELGSDPLNIFTADQFDMPLWLGMTVATDTEMSPRTPLTSVGFAFKAEDAETVNGSTAAELDQSAHVSDLANPHAVTPSQIGAATSGALTNHTINNSNPHGVTAAQVGAATSAEILAHTVIPGAHHSRYSNSEAVSAMGTTSNTNSLRHNRYTNANAVTAIKAADGAGTGLDADLIDGMQANELIDAAQDEVRTPIPNDGSTFVINNPGSYFLTGDKTVAGSNGITINASHVTIYLMGFSMIGNGSSAYGIYSSGKNNINIRNGSVRDFGLSGIQLTNTQDAEGNNQTHGVNAINNGSFGSSSYRSGINLTGLSNQIERCVASGNGTTGLAVQDSGIIRNSTSNNNGGDGIFGLNNSLILNNTSTDNAGYGISGGATGTVSGNIVSWNTGSYGIYTGPESIISNNISKSNTGIGIHGNGRNLITGNTSTNNTGDGISCENYCTISGNMTHNNSGDGIEAKLSCSISNNTVGNNSAHGIRVNSECNISNNQVYYHPNQYMYGIYGGTSTTVTNNTVQRSGSSGIYVSSGSSIIGNTTYNNDGSGIYTTDSSTIRNNTSYTNGGYGIRGASGNQVSNNTTSANASWGIYLLNSNTIQDNTIYRNNMANSASQGGLRVAYNNKIKGNTLNSNFQFNIKITGADNAIEDNLTTDSARGIDFEKTGNFYGNNRASGNTINYEQNGTIQSTNTYLPNISF